MRPRWVLPWLGLVLGAAIVPAAHAAVTATVTGGELRVVATTNDAITVSCSTALPTGAARVNGLDPVPATLCGAVTSVVVDGGPGNPATLQGVTANLSGLVPGAYTTLTSIRATGTPFADTVTGSPLADVLDGGAGGDQLQGSDGNDSLTGGADGDVLQGGAGSDLLAGGPGFDTYLLLPAVTVEVDTITELAEPGDDRLDFGALAGESVTVDLATAGTTIATHANRTVNVAAAGMAANVEDATAGGAGSSLTGNGAANDLDGGAGVDVITGGDGSDRLSGGGGDDSLAGGAGDDLLAGGDGSDSLVGSTGSDEYDFSAAPAPETDTITELPGQGLDGIDVNAPTDVVVDLSTAGTTVVTHLNRTVVVAAPGQAANLENAETSGGADTLTGNATSNALEGGNGPDTLTGGLGSDRLDGGDGSDSLVGGPGDDRYDFRRDGDAGEVDTIAELAGEGVDAIRFPEAFSLEEDDPGPLVVNLASADTSLGTAGQRTLRVAAAGQAANLEHAFGTDGPDSLTGNAADNLLYGGEGDDVLAGGPGDDVYLFADPTSSDRQSGGNEADTVVELPDGGTDTLDFGLDEAGVRQVFGGFPPFPVAGGEPLVLDLSTTALQFGASPGRTLRAQQAGQAGNLENVRGGASADRITGTAGANDLDGGGGDDVLVALGGDDVLIGGQGSDALDGGPGDDRYAFALATRTRSETDTITERPGEGRDVLDLAALPSVVATTIDLSAPGTALGTTGFRALQVAAAGQAAALEDVVGGRGADRLTGNAAANDLAGGPGDDVLTGNAGGDALAGGAGANVLAGGAGDDLLEGGPGADQLDGGAGDDLLASGEGDDTLLGRAGNDVLDAGEGANRLLGGAGRDRLVSGAGADQLEGGAGDDALSSGAGADRLVGGPGLDALAAGAGADTLLARDRAVDALDGGPGRDRARVDPGLDRRRSIERLL